MSAKKNCDKKIYHLPGTSLEGGEGGGSKVTLAEALSAQSFYNVKNGSSNIMSKVCQRISVMKTYTLYVSRQLAF